MCLILSFFLIFLAAQSTATHDPNAVAGNETYYPKESLGLVFVGDLQHKYYFSPISVSYFEASAFCMSYGMDLINIDDEHENTLIKQYLQSAGLDGNYYTSAHSVQRSYKKWADGRNITFTDWCAGKDANIADCLVMNSNCWSEQYCQLNNFTTGVVPFFGNFYICETTDTLEYSEVNQQRIYSSTSLDLITLPLLQHQYSFSNTEASYIQAQHFCNSYGMDLINLDTEDEYNLIKEQLVLLGYEDWEIFYTSGHTMNRGQWKWADGTLLTFVDWCEGRPLNPYINQCLGISELCWYDTLCQLVVSGTDTFIGHKFICETRDTKKTAINEDIFLEETKSYDHTSLDLISFEDLPNKYFISSIGVSYNEALRFCNLYGMDLVNFETTEENDIIKTYLQSAGFHNATHLYTSAHIMQRNQWLWIDGTNVMYFDWCSGQPNDPNAQFCLTMSKYCWHDFLCNYNAGGTPSFICETR